MPDVLIEQSLESIEISCEQGPEGAQLLSKVILCFDSNLNPVDCKVDGNGNVGGCSEDEEVNQYPVGIRASSKLEVNSFCLSSPLTYASFSKRTLTDGIAWSTYFRRHI